MSDFNFRKLTQNPGLDYITFKLLKMSNKFTILVEYLTINNDFPFRHIT